MSAEAKPAGGCGCGTGQSQGSGDGASKGKVSGVSPMDTTKAIRDVSDKVRLEYERMAWELLKPEIDDRDARVAIFAARQFSPDAQKHFKEAIQERERIHFVFMNQVFPEGYEKEFGRPIPADRPKHDCTKDALFAFILAMQFDVMKNPETETLQDLKKRFMALVTHELNRHYTLEPHHPEYEKFVKKDCDDVDILEMAIDRLSRNVQFNHGDINSAQMNKFLPKFFINDTEKKQQKYVELMNKYMEYVSQRSRELYYDRV